MEEPSTSHRRDFLTGRSAGQVAGDALVRAAGHLAEFADALAPAEVTTGGEKSAGYVLTLRRRAMACDFEIRLNADRENENTHTAAAMRALDLVEDLEDQLTVYRDTSEVMDLNRAAADDWFEVESRLFQMLELGDKIYGDTGGAFDMTGGPLSRLWGFDRRQGRVPSDEEIEQTLAHVGWKHVELDPTRNAVRFAKRGVDINLNSIGKGYAIDREAELLVEDGVTDFLLHGGRSTLVARGRRTGEEGWIVRLRHPLRPQQVIAEFVLHNEALSTSGSATQSFMLGGRRYGHLIDPRTGWPADAMHSATVLASNGALADALSTAFYVMGEEATAKYCEAHPDTRAVLVLPAKQPGEVRLRTFNLVEATP
jgi:thiamine biosynthesis lipoprotein